MNPSDLATDIVWNQFTRFAALMAIRDLALRHPDPRAFLTAMVEGTRERLTAEMDAEQKAYMDEAVRSEDPDVIAEADRESAQVRREIEAALEHLEQVVYGTLTTGQPPQS